MSDEPTPPTPLTSSKPRVWRDTKDAREDVDNLGKFTVLDEMGQVDTNDNQGGMKQ